MSRDHEPRPEVRQGLPLDTLPASELLLKPDALEKTWPPDVAQNPEFRRQVEERDLLRRRLDAVLERLPRPDVSLADAVTQGAVDAQAVDELYASLTALLRDPEYRRLVLYLPFEFLPADGHEAFRSTYMAAWRSLLTTHDVRANFVDGDVLEVEQRAGDLLRVVKAAHLIPKLVEQGWLTVDNVIGMLRDSTDQTLTQSIAETIPVLVDMKLLDGRALARFARLGMALVDAKIAEAKVVKPERRQPEGLTLENIEQQIRERFALIDTDTAGYEGMTEKRVAWLRSEKKRKSVDTIARMVKERVAAGQFDDASRAFVLRPEAHAAMRIACVEGIRSALEELAKHDATQAQARYHELRDVLVALRADAALRDVTTMCLARLHGVGVVDAKELAAHDIVMPALGGPFSKNLERMQNDLREMGALVNNIEADPVLGQTVYPAMLVFGSRVKGYGAENADIDVAIFVKPGVDQAKKEELREHLRAALSHEKIQGDAIEFWLKEHDGKLLVDDHPGFDSHVGESDWTHILFGAAWEGDVATIRELRSKLLSQYFLLPDRRAYLEQIEHDVVQYRLMHKGYSRFHPSFGGVSTPHASSIDGASTFWDSGYRQTATKLFVSNVFLPKVK